MVAGDLILLEGTHVSDVVRFNLLVKGVPGSLPTILFYSDVEDVDTLGSDPADTGFPASLYSNVIYMTESGMEGSSNGAIYHPLAGQPGFLQGFHGPQFDVLYSITSDFVPEPATWTMMLVGFFGLGAMVRRSRRMLANATA
jgi:hypothetical protein